MNTIADIFRDDNNNVQMPALELHLEQAHQYGQDMLELGLSPTEIVRHSMNSKEPLKAFLTFLDTIGGYKEDPIRKKSSLLALCLSQRPETFLIFGEGEKISPIIDYHCMRSVLRIGLIDVLNDELTYKLSHRKLVNPEDEWAVRFAAYQIENRLVDLSGQPISVIDQFFFRYMRSHCPEMSDPICSQCVLDDFCEKRKQMFQPVIRTTFY
jgi:hypothetical protein